MLQTCESESDSATWRERFLESYGWMLLARVVDDKLGALYRAGKGTGGVYLGAGQEALSAAIGVSLEKGDVFAPLIRDGAGRLAFGESVADAIRTYLGSSLGPMRGRDGNVHRGRPAEGILPMLSHLGAMVSVVNGVLMARRSRGESGVVGAASLGDGATSTGAFHEALNQAAVEKLPLVLVVANNRYAYSTPNERQFACRSLVDKAAGYGVRGRTCDGVDLESCLEVVGGAVEAARAGEGPQLVVAELLRLCGHGEHDDASYVASDLKASPLGRDCLEVAARKAVGQGWIHAAELEALKAAKREQVETVVIEALGEPSPDPYQESWCALASKHLSETHEGV